MTAPASDNVFFAGKRVDNFSLDDLYTFLLRRIIYPLKPYFKQPLKIVFFTP